MSETQRVCKHCDLSIERCGNRWISNGMFKCWENEMEHCHEPLSEPASTGEPPREGCLPGCFVDTLSSPNHWIEHAEGCPNNQPQHIATTIYNHEKQTVIVERAARPSEPSAPQTSGEPAELSDRAKVALYPEMRDELNLLRSENSSLRAYRLNTEFDAQLSAPQPVSGDAPKVEEIAAKCVELVTRKFEEWLNEEGPSLPVLDVRASDFAAILRCPFPPASQTPRTIIANVNVDAFLTAIGIDTSKGNGLGLEWEPRYIATKAFDLATPASTARKSPDSHLGAVRD